MRAAPLGRALASALVLGLAGCASLGPDVSARVAAGLPARVDLESIPFHPQEALQCGPAALATVLNSAGVDVAPAALEPLVFVPERGGSLNIELVAATRRFDRLPYVLAPSLGDLLTEVAAGHPVLVLQNLGLESLPAWHFAVVVGYDVEAGRLTLRSGSERELATSARRFRHSWERAGNWAMVALDPDELPATATAQRFLEAAAGLESARRLEAARMAYARATRTWPDEPLAWLGTGNTEYALGDLERAVDSFRRALELDPDDLVARNNLAQVLAEAGCVEAARAQIARAEARAAGTSFEAAVAATSADVRAAALASEPAARRLRCDEVVAAPPE